MKLKMIYSQQTISTFQSYAAEILDNEVFLSMDQYPHHADISCLEHSIFVAYMSFLLASKWHLDVKSITRGALLHDFYLYDWHLRQPGHKTGIQLHGFKHPKKALHNALKYFKLNLTEADIIEKHMWPLTFYKIPTYKATFLVTFVDKYCSIKELLNPNVRIFIKKLSVEILELR